jgi:hypothetical protein
MEYDAKLIFFEFTTVLTPLTVIEPFQWLVI